MSGMGSGVCGARNSYSTHVKVGNWSEDRAGLMLAAAAPARHAAAEFEVSTTAAAYTAPPAGSGARTAFAPRPLDQLDGALMMSHGTDITNRAPGAGHFVSFAHGTMLGVRPASLMASDGVAAPRPRPGAPAPQAPPPPRTELMREKAKLRAAGVESWDPRAAPIVGGSGTTLATPASGVTLGATAAVPCATASFSGDAAHAAAVLAATQPTADRPFGRRSEFSRSNAPRAR